MKKPVSKRVFSFLVSYSHDTSFTLSNTAAKVYKDFPHTKLVFSKLSGGIVEETNIIYTSYGERTLHLDLFSIAKGEKKYIQE